MFGNLLYKVKFFFSFPEGIVYLFLYKQDIYVLFQGKAHAICADL